MTRIDDEIDSLWCDREEEIKASGIYEPLIIEDEEDEEEIEE